MTSPFNYPHNLTIMGTDIDHDLQNQINNILKLHNCQILSTRQLETNAEYSAIRWNLEGGDQAIKLASEKIQQLTHTHQIDSFCRPTEQNVDFFKLIAFDMDSTLIEVEVIDELAIRAGVGSEVSAITERAMRGELDFNSSLIERVSLLEGLPIAIMEKIAGNLPLTKGVIPLTKTLRSMGYRIAILSGGFTYFGEYLQKIIGADYVFCNQLEDKNGYLTGQVIGPIVNAQKKAELLQTIASQQGIEQAQCIAVGDGANDLLMLKQAGMGIAFHAKPIVAQSVQHQINYLGLDTLLYSLGVSAQ